MQTSYVQQPERSIGRAADSRGRNFCPLPVLLFSFVALVIFLFADLRVADADIWFHLRNAQHLMTSHAFLHEDLYTFTSAGSPLVDHEWLSELGYYVAFQVWGLRGLLAVLFVLLWLIFGGIYILAMRRGAHCGDAALLTTAGVALGSYSFGPRMNHFGWLCLVALLLVLERFRQTGKGLWVLVPLFALWINLHGSWVFGLVVFGIYLVSGLAEGQRGVVVATRWKPAQLRHLTEVFAASVAVLFINPYGYKLVWYPFDLLFRQKANLDNVIEWQSVDFHTGWGKLALCMIFAVMSAAWFSRKTWEVRDVVLVTFAIWASLTHLRFLLFAAIVLVPILAPRMRLFESYDREDDVPSMNLAVTIAIAALIVFAYPSAARLQEVVDLQFPRNALRFLQQERIQGRLFHYYDYGGYIEWNAPAVRTFADGRTDIFTYNGVFDDYIAINQIERPLELLDKYEIDYVLFPLGKRLTYVLDQSSAWHRIYGDQLVNIYQRVPMAATPTPKKPG